MALATGRSSNGLLRENGSFWLPVVMSGGVGASPVCAHKYKYKKYKYKYKHKHKKYKYNRSDGGDWWFVCQVPVLADDHPGKRRLDQPGWTWSFKWTNMVGPGPFDGPTWLASSKPTDVEAERAHENGPGWKKEKISQKMLAYKCSKCLWVNFQVFEQLTSSAVCCI